MSITHEEAHRMIQFDADKALDARGHKALDAHLDDCAECRVYAGEIREMEGILQHVMTQQWSYHPLPLSMDMVKGGMTKHSSRVILATRLVMIAAIFVLSVFSLWQVTRSNDPSSPSLAALPVPTPSVQFTHTSTSVVDCEETRYTVREGETLESIAGRFSVSKEAILSANSMDIEVVHAGMEIVIPVCGPTPTTNPPTITITYPPATHFTTNTPGG
ncbi:LysM peptidoglycan-binding domain-containing protein [Chloroflexi bacterium CFX6]|nr:LysM peptidoglycan-binding domain-containing protein [Chloroflexi bacterium CFX6]